MHKAAGIRTIGIIENLINPSQRLLAGFMTGFVAVDMRKIEDVWL